MKETVEEWILRTGKNPIQLEYCTVAGKVIIQCPRCHKSGSAGPRETSSFPVSDKQMIWCYDCVDRGNQSNG